MAEASALEDLLADMPESDYLGRLSIGARRDDVLDSLARVVNNKGRKARIALYFAGEPVMGSQGVLAGFGTKVLGSFQDLVSKVWGTVDGDGLGTARGEASAQLHITSLVHGSFGFLLEELNQQEGFFNTNLSKTADQVAEYLAGFADEDEATFSDVIERLDPKVFRAVREFFGSVFRGNATFRLVEGERDDKFDQVAVVRAWHRAEASNIDEDQIRLHGKLIGLLPLGRRFEFEPDDGSRIIQGKISGHLSSGYLQRIDDEKFLGKRWTALIHKRQVNKAGRPPVETYTLLQLDEIDGGPTLS